ncbi:MAG: DUF4432 family protein, partial [Proteobacteria bacterium]|nr:DUF4432 family protein [Pseudomonadota bacterium]
MMPMGHPPSAVEGAGRRPGPLCYSMQGRGSRTTGPVSLAAGRFGQRRESPMAALAGLGLAAAQELHEAILRVKEDGKRVEVFLGNAGIREYLVASAASRIRQDHAATVRTFRLEDAFAEPSGLGWLDGFDELLVRCGLESNGAPEFQENGRLQFPLHGRIGNKPAHKVELTIDGDSGEITLVGVVEEIRFHFLKLRMTTTIKTKLGEPGLRISDTIENLSG